MLPTSLSPHLYSTKFRPFLLSVCSTDVPASMELTYLFSTEEWNCLSFGGFELFALDYMISFGPLLEYMNEMVGHSQWQIQIQMKTTIRVGNVATQLILMIRFFYWLFFSTLISTDTLTVWIDIGGLKFVKSKHIARGSWHTLRAFPRVARYLKRFSTLFSQIFFIQTGFSLKLLLYLLDGAFFHSIFPPRYSLFCCLKHFGKYEISRMVISSQTDWVSE